MTARSGVVSQKKASRKADSSKIKSRLRISNPESRKNAARLLDAISRIPAPSAYGAKFSKIPAEFASNFSSTERLSFGWNANGADMISKPRPSELMNQSPVFSASQIASPLPKCQADNAKKPIKTAPGRKYQTPTTSEASSRYVPNSPISQRKDRRARGILSNKIQKS